MNKTVSFKKTAALLTAIAMLTALFASFGVTTANAATVDVSLYSSEVYFCKYGITTRNVYVKTDSVSSNQDVTVHYHYLDGEWRDSEATYFTTLSDGSKIWKATISSYRMEYAIKYTANGNEYWDNNNGQNYTNENIGVAPITVNRGRPFYGGFNDLVSVSLQNYAYEKEVAVRFTTDSWNTYTDVPMNYESTNDNGTEVWTTYINTYTNDLSGFEFCVYYTVNGQTYWANNFNQNYDASYRVYP